MSGMATKPDPMRPSPTLLCKLGSIAVHADELANPRTGHYFDKKALDTLLEDAEVSEWMAAMRKMAMLPVKRGDRK